MSVYNEKKCYINKNGVPTKEPKWKIWMTFFLISWRTKEDTIEWAVCFCFPKKSWKCISAFVFAPAGFPHSTQINFKPLQLQKSRLFSDDGERYDSQNEDTDIPVIHSWHCHFLIKMKDFTFNIYTHMGNRVTFFKCNAQTRCLRGKMRQHAWPTEKCNF